MKKCRSHPSPSRPTKNSPSDKKVTLHQPPVTRQRPNQGQYPARLLFSGLCDCGMQFIGYATYICQPRLLSTFFDPEDRSCHETRAGSLLFWRQKIPMNIAEDKNPPKGLQCGFTWKMSPNNTNNRAGIPCSSDSCTFHSANLPLLITSASYFGTLRPRDCNQNCNMDKKSRRSQWC